MANVLIEQATMNSIGDSIRSKLNSTDTYLPRDMPDAIKRIKESGGSLNRMYVSPNQYNYMSSETDQDGYEFIPIFDAESLRRDFVGSKGIVLCLLRYRIPYTGDLGKVTVNANGWNKIISYESCRNSSYRQIFEIFSLPFTSITGGDLIGPIATKQTASGISSGMAVMSAFVIAVNGISGFSATKDTTTSRIFNTSAGTSLWENATLYGPSYSASETVDGGFYYRKANQASSIYIMGPIAATTTYTGTAPNRNVWDWEYGYPYNYGNYTDQAKADRDARIGPSGRVCFFIAPRLEEDFEQAFHIGRTSSSSAYYFTTLRLDAVGEENGGYEPGVEIDRGEFTVNGTYWASNGHAYNPVEVKVPETEYLNLEIYTNGTWSLPEGKGYRSVVAQIPQNLDVSDLSVVENGVYEPGIGEAYGTVTVDIPYVEKPVIYVADMGTTNYPLNYLFYYKPWPTKTVIDCNNRVLPFNYTCYHCDDANNKRFVNLAGVNNLQSSFYQTNVTTLDDVIPTDVPISAINFQNCFTYSAIRTVPNWMYNAKTGTFNGYTNLSYIFQNCYYLTDDVDFGAMGFPATINASESSLPQYNGVSGCYKVRKVLNIPCSSNNSTYSYYMSFTGLQSLDTLTWASSDARNWKNHTIDCRTFGFFAQYTNGNTYFGSSYRITNADTYASLKDSPNRWTADRTYAMWNHDSMVRLFNSLPDVSAFDTDGTCKVLAYGDQGSNTDAGGCGDLTEAELAIATEKGWTVTLS